MDPWKQTFVRPPKSKAVAIVNPESRERQPQLQPQARPLQPAPALPIPAALQNLATNSNLQSSSTPSNSSEEVEPGFNVYARPFVPESLTIINSLEGQRVNTPQTDQINFDNYVRNFMGLAFLPAIPEPLERTENTFLNLSDSNIYTHYGHFYQHHLNAEIISQRRENEAYSLFGHKVTILSQNPGELPTCSFLVPGLRENSPYVEEGDVVQLRLLRYDHAGKVLGMEQWLSPIRQPAQPGFLVPGGRWRGEPAPGWTGIIYNARVSAVQRKQEQLLVKVMGLHAETTGPAAQYTVRGNSSLRFNVQFPVPDDRYTPMLQVLPIIQQSLKLNLFPNRFDHPPIRQNWIQSMLVPTASHNAVQRELNPWAFDRPFFDQQLNREQQKAIESICSQNYGSLPFLISGPPGTGKTKTLVETALQLVMNVDGVDHILFCAPSDQAADTLVQRLGSHLQPNELLRLNRPSRTFAEVSDKVLLFCFVAQNAFSLPPLKKLMSYKIVVTTCRDAALLMYARLTNADLYSVESGLRSALHPFDNQPKEVKLHWTGLLIDEAAQAIEPEALVAISIVAPPDCHEISLKPLVVMAGDENQLGPRTSLRSSPLRKSLFARLFGRNVYAGHPLARGAAGKALPTLTKNMLPIRRPAFANLNRNYRSHPAILAVPSFLFYNDTLEPEATDTDRLVSWDGWKGKGWPILLHHNNSDDDLETDGGGWYNKGEAEIACGYAARLVKSGLVDQNEICIMSPFKSQVQCLRKTIRERKFGSLWEVDIGPMEAFQGLERGVVILCTTRSRQRYVAKDQELDWGVIGLPNKMNVALTRAKFGLIVIGKKDVLMEDFYWKTFFEFCTRNGLITGDVDEGAPPDERYYGCTRLEKTLLMRERDMNHNDNDADRVLRGVSQEDEMWTHGMQAALDMNSEDGYDNFDQGEWAPE